MKNYKTIVSKSDYETLLKELHDRVGNKLHSHGSTSVFILMALGLTGCSGGGGEKQHSSAGFAIKGPLSNATVFIDLDNDSALDSNELSTTTQSDGSFSFATSNQELLKGDIIVQTNENTTDASSGEALIDLTLTANEGSTVVSPATTLIKSIVDGGSTVTAAEAKVQAALGITEDVDLSTFNPFSTDNIAAAKEVEAAAQKIVAIANTVAAAAEAAGADKDVALASALDTIAAEAKSAATPLDLSDTTGSGVISKVVTAVNTATSTVADASITSAIANINTAIDTTIASATTLDDAIETFAVAQSTLTEAAIATVTGDTYIATQLGTTSDPIALKTISSTSISIKGNKGSVSESDEAITATGSLTLSDPDTSDPVTYRVKEGSATLLGTSNLLGGSLNVDANGNWSYTLDVTGDATKLALLQELQSKTYQGDLATNSGKPAISNFQIIEKFEVQIEKVDSTTDAENPTVTDATYADSSLVKKVITIVINGANDTVNATANGAAISDISDAVQGTAITNIDASQYFTDKELDAGDTTGGASGAGDKLTFTVAGLPEGLSINAPTGVISGALSSNTLGDYNVVVTAKDIAGTSATQSFVILVDNVNDAPTVSAAMTDKTTNEDTLFSLDTSSAFSDADIQFIGNTDNNLNNEVLTYSATLANASPLPSWLSINSTTGVLSGTPENADVGTISVTVTVTDVYNTTVSDTFDIAVSNTNDAPTASNKTGVTLGDLNTLSIDASYLSANIADVDVGDIVKVTSVSIATGGGLVAETSTGSGVWVYTPPDVDVDTAAVLRYTIADIAGSTATANVEVNIVDAIPLANPVNEESSAVQLAVPSGSDFSSATVSFDNGQTAKGTFNSSNLTFTPAADFNGTVNFTITLADGTTTLPGVLVVQPVNDAPVYSAASATASFVENAAVTNVVHDASTGASDVDGDTLTYSISGTDAGSFDVDSASGEITFKASPNYETKSSYSLSLTATDGSDATDTQALTVTVTDANDSPVFSAATATGSVAENAATSTQIFDANSTDEDTGDTLTYTVAGTDAGLVNIDSSTGVVSLKSSANFETKTSYSFNVLASDGKSSATQAVTVSVTNENEAPTITSSTAGTVSENEATSTVIYTAAASDVDANDTITYSVSGTDGSLLNIDTSTGNVTLKTSADYETKSSYSFDLVATDAARLTDTETVTVSVSDVNDAPTAAALSSVFLSDANTLTIDESYLNSVINDVDAGDTLKITNVSIANSGIGSAAETSTGSGSWVYTPSSVSSNTDVVLNYTVSDAAGSTDTSTLTITVVDTIPLANPVNEESSAVQLAVPSGSDFSSATVSFDNGQTAKGTFNSSNLTFTPAADFNGTVNFTITLADGTTTLPGVLVVQPVNDAPVYSAASATASFVENAAVTNVVHDASTGASDVDGDTLTYSISGTDAGSFDVDSASGEITFKASPNYETKSSYSLSLTATDGSDATDTQALTVTVTDANDSPVFSAATATGSVAENAATSTQIFDANSTDEDTGDTLTYTVAGTDAGLVNIDSSTGVVSLKSSANFETKTSYSFNVLASDGKSSATQAVTVSVTNENEAPTITSSTAGTVSENEATSTVIYTAAASDVDANDTITYSVSGTDGSLLNIDTSTGNVTLKTSADYETKSSYSFDLVATDAAGLTDTETVTVSVSDVNDAPTAAALSSVFLSDANTLTIDESYLNSVINDVDAGDTLKITNVSIANSGIGSAAETSTGSGSWVYTPSSVSSNTDVVLNYTVSDAAGSTDTSTLTITVVDTIPLANPVNEESSAVQLAVPSGSDFSSATVSFDNGQTAKGTFNSSNLTFTPAADFNGTVNFTITLADGTTTLPGVLVVQPVNDAPVYSAASATASFVENAAVTNVVHDASTGASDVDGDTLTYSISGTDAGSFDVDSASGEITFKASPNYETKSSYSLSLTATDGSDATDTQALTVTVTDANDSPVFSAATATGSVAENAATSTQIFDANSTDEDTGDTLTYTVAGTDAGLVNIDSSTGVVSLKSSANFETKTSYSFNVLASDGKSSATQAVTVSVTNENEAPTITSSTAGTVSENEATSTVIYTAAASDVDANDTITYSVSGTDGSLLNIDTSTGNVTLKTSADYETKSSYSFDLVATDAAGLTDTETVTVSVSDVNDAPTGSVAISGSAKAYETLTATNNIADEDGMGTVSYQWFANGATISGATSNTYSVKYTDIGSVITAKATFTDLGGTSETVDSSTTSTVVDADYLVTTSNVRAIATAGTTDQTIAQYVQGITDFTNVWAFDLNIDASSLNGGSLKTFSGLVADINIANTSSLSAVTTGSHLSVGWITGVTGEQNNLISSADFGKIAGAASTALVDNDASTATPETAKLATVYIRTADATSSVDLNIVDITFAGIDGTDSMEASPLIVEII